MRSEALALSLLVVAGCGPNRTRPMRDGWDGGTMPPLECVPDLDGRIEARELAPALGVAVGYLINPAGEDREVDLVGGAGTWDLGSDYASDARIEVSASALDGRWFRDRFPADASFVTPIDPGATTLGVYRHSESALELLGVASVEDGATILVYETPITLFRFPMQAGDHWISTAEIRNGTLNGLPYAGRDTYDVHVAAEGTLVLPDLSFDRALRVTTAVTIEPAAGEAVSRRQSSFLFECFGEVARAISRDGETSDDFTIAAELRRFGL